MKYLGVSLILVSFSAIAEVAWDIPVKEFGRATDKVYLMDLTVGESAKISEYTSFCTTKNNTLAVSSITEVGAGEYGVKLLPGNKVSLQVSNEKEFIDSLITSEAYASCEWWTAHKGKYILVIDNINGKKNISALGK